MRRARPIIISREDHELLQRLAESSDLRRARRARVVLLAAEGHTNKKIAAGLKVTERMVATWRTRFARHGTAVLLASTRPRPLSALNGATRRRILKLAATEESVTRVARLTGVSESSVRRVLRSRLA